MTYESVTDVGKPDDEETTTTTTDSFTVTVPPGRVKLNCLILY